MWKFTELRDLYKKGGWKESHFIIRQQGLNSKNSNYSVNSNTIERPMASQQADRSSSMRNLRTISAPIPQQVISQVCFTPEYHQNLDLSSSTNQLSIIQSQHMNPGAGQSMVDGLQQQHQLDQTGQPGMFNSVPMTYLTNQIGTNMNGPQAVYAQVDRQRKRGGDMSQQINC